MKIFLACLLVIACSFTASATSYAPALNYGSFDWGASSNTGTWTPRILDLPHYNGTPRHPFQNPHYLYPASFSNATLSVTCNSLCAVGSSFAINLAMSNFRLTEWRPYAYPDLNTFVGTLNLVTMPLVLKSSSGIALARFTLTGDLMGCTDATCANSLFSLNVFTYGHAKISYNLAGGQLAITGVQYTLPEPSTLTLLGTGVVFILGKLRQMTGKRT